MSFKNHDQILDQAYRNPNNTAITQPTIPVNKIIQAQYNMDQPAQLTKTMMWDMEVHKAGAPDKYIPTVVQPGSAEKFPSTKDGDFEYFTRVSKQRCWKDQDTYTLVIEHVRLDHNNKVAIFIGDREFTAPDGRYFAANDDQPLFHVEHSVVGDGGENEPENFWRIVHLTNDVDEDMKTVFATKAKYQFLPIYTEVYIREILQLGLTKKDV
jgi:hypothetical protein